MPAKKRKSARGFLGRAWKKPIVRKAAKAAGTAAVIGTGYVIGNALMKKSGKERDLNRYRDQRTQRQSDEIARRQKQERQENLYPERKYVEVRA